jgi:hypothetical protein
LNSSGSNDLVCVQFVRITCVCRLIKPFPQRVCRARDHRVRTATPMAHIDCQRAVRNRLDHQCSVGASYDTLLASHRQGRKPLPCPDPPHASSPSGPCRRCHYGNSAGAGYYLSPANHARAGVGAPRGPDTLPAGSNRGPNARLDGFARAPIVQRSAEQSLGRRIGEPARGRSVLTPASLGTEDRRL